MIEALMILFFLGCCAGGAIVLTVLIVAYAENSNDPIAQFIRGAL